MPRINHNQRIDGHWVIAHIINCEHCSDLARQDFWIARDFDRKGFRVYKDNESVGKMLFGVCDTLEIAFRLVQAQCKG